MDSNTLSESVSEEILEKIKETLDSEICQELTAVWTEVWSEEERMKRKHILAVECQKEIRDFLREVLTNENRVKNEYISRIEELLDEMNELQKSLEIAIPHENLETLPLHTMAANLNKKAEKYRVIKNQRINKLNELVKKETTLCEKLGMIRQEINTSEIPATAKLKLFEDHIAAMEQEKLDRSVTFLEQRQAIIKLYEDLEKEPLLNFEKEIVSEASAENFALTNENMSKIIELRNKLESELEEAKEEVKELVKKLSVLWNYIGESESYTKEFLSKNKGHTVAVINALKKELARCETIQQENISKIVEKIRQVLVEEWDRCLISQEEREKFRPFNINCFTEDLCDLHELEIQRLKDFYRDNEQIFVLILKHEKLFNELLDLENDSKNANRYQNRGGQLLQEEKKRKQITKELPAVEEELRMLLNKYLEKHGEPFTSFGVPMETILDEQWKTHFDQKTIEKLFRKKNGRTPLGKRMCTTFTPELANKMPVTTCDMNVPSSTKYTLRIPVRKKKNYKDNEAQTTMILEPTYDEFQSGLESKVKNSSKSKMEMFHSTAVADSNVGVLERNNKVHPLSVKNTNSPMKTVKTSPPMCSPSRMNSPKTVPRARRHSSIFIPSPNF